jgi:predicted PurR-regulated permease PerM
VGITRPLSADSRLTPASLYRAVLLAFGLVVAGLIFRELVTLVLAMLIVVVLALPLSAAATSLRRFGVPRPLGVVLAMVLGLAALIGLVTAIVPVFTTEINQFADALPTMVNSLRHNLGHLTGTSPTRIGQQIQHFVDGYTQHPERLLGPVASFSISVAGALAAIVVVLLTAVYTAIHPEPLIEGLTRLVPPARRPVASHVLARLREAYLGWLRGLVLGMLILGVLTYLALRIAGIPFAAFFAILTAVAIIVPYFGALASSIPPILYALAISPGKAVLVAALYLVIHEVESNLIAPVVMSRAVKLHPAAVVVGVVAVEELFGFVGLFVAVPILVTIKILIEELWINPLETAPGRLAVVRSSSGSAVMSAAPATSDSHGTLPSSSPPAASTPAPRSPLGSVSFPSPSVRESHDP